MSLAVGANFVKASYGQMFLASMLGQVRVPDVIVLLDRAPGQAMGAEWFEFMAGVAKDLGVRLVYVTGTPGVLMAPARRELEHLLLGYDVSMLAIFDDDAWYPPGYVASALELLENWDVVGAPLYSPITVPGVSYKTSPQFAAELKDYVKDDVGYWAGGTFVYRRTYAGFWDKVVLYSCKISDDGIWLELVKKAGARVCPEVPGIVYHRRVYNPDRYAGWNEHFLEVRRRIREG